MEFLVVFLLIVGVIFLGMMAIQVFFLLALSRALAQCEPHNRTMEPGMVWLNLIPLFGLVWMFITVMRISESLKFEFRERGLHRRDDTYGHGLGIAMCISPFAAGFPVTIVLWVMYWVKIAEYTRKLESGYRRDRDEEDEDDRPRRSRRRDDDYDDEDDRPRRRDRD